MEVIHGYQNILMLEDTKFILQMRTMVGLLVIQIDIFIQLMVERHGFLLILNQKYLMLEGFIL